jgi:hypothetical protein
MEFGDRILVEHVYGLVLIWQIHDGTTATPRTLLWWSWR